MYEKLKTSASYIRDNTKYSPKIGLILGSGLGVFVDQVEDPDIIPFTSIPFFKETSVEGHQGRLIIGKIKGVEVAILQGRLHVYEGHPMEDIVFPVRVLATLGIESLVLTNAAGGINLDYRPGDLVVVNDHINLMAKNPLVGPNISELGPRFPDMTNAYNKVLQEKLFAAGSKAGIKLKTGVYISWLGPTYETPAEIRMMRVLGGDLVGMSTVPECIAANHLGVNVCCLSCVTNMAAGIENKNLDHEDVKKQAFQVMDSFSSVLVEFIQTI